MFFCTDGRAGEDQSPSPLRRVGEVALGPISSGLTGPNPRAVPEPPYRDWWFRLPPGVFNRHPGSGMPPSSRFSSAPLGEVSGRSTSATSDTWSEITSLRGGTATVGTPSESVAMATSVRSSMPPPRVSATGQSSRALQ